MEGMAGGGRGPLVADSNAMAFAASPSPTVWRKRLLHVGPAEAGRVTSVVRFDAGARFARHGHPAGEEILVLDGTFSDETGDYPAGSYLFNPEGFAHAPFSKDGCLVFVKLRQHPGTGRSRVALRMEDLPTEPGRTAGILQRRLYGEAGFPEEARLVDLPAGCRIASHEHPAGEELFVLAGEIRDENGRYGAGTWVCYPPGSRHQPSSETGARLYVRTGGDFAGFGDR